MTVPQQEPHTPGVQESPNDQTGPNGPRTPSETTSAGDISFVGTLAKSMGC